MKIRPFTAVLFHSDGQTDSHDESNSRFSQLCECIYKMTLLCANYMSRVPTVQAVQFIVSLIMAL